MQWYEISKWQLHSAKRIKEGFLKEAEFELNLKMNFEIYQMFLEFQMRLT